MNIKNKVTVINGLNERKLNEILLKVGSLSFIDDVSATKKEVAKFFDISVRTIERYLSCYSEDFLSYGKTVFILERNETDKTVGRNMVRNLVLLNKKHIFLLACLLYSKSDIASKIVSYLIEIENNSTIRTKRRVITNVMTTSGYSQKDLSNKIDSLEKEIIKLKPLVSFAETIMLSKDDATFDDFCKATYDKFELGRNTLFKLLREEGILNKYNVPMQCYMKRRYFKVRKLRVLGRIKTQTVLTGKGQVWLFNRLSK